MDNYPQPPSFAPDARATAQVGEFAQLRVVSLQSIGAFLDWGLPKDLFLPYSEQTRELQEGDKVSVFIYLDKAGRPTASMRLEKYVDRERIPYQEKEKVELLIVSETDLGFKATINNRHVGVLYRNEIFQPIREGQRISGYIRRIREDGKIDLSLYQTGVKERGDIQAKILSLLETRGGFLPMNDKSSAEVIYDLFGVSKKKFKMAIGGLYKKKLITLEDTGIRQKS